MGPVTARLAVMALAGTGCITKSNPHWGQNASAGTGTSAGSSTSGAVTTASATTTSTTEATAGSATSTASTTSTTGDADTTDADGSSTGTGGFAVDPCEDMPFFLETFQALPLDPSRWSGSPGSGIDATIENGALHVAVDLQQGTLFEYMIFDAVVTLPAAGVIGFEVLEIPDPSFNAQVYLGLETSLGTLLYIDFNSGDIKVLYRNETLNFSTYGETPWDPIAHRWVRILYDISMPTVVFETSPDAETWTHFHTYDLTAADVDITDAILQFGVGAWTDPLEADLAAIDNIFACFGQ